ncbi:hypothetical protein, partial [Paenibacillus phytohabitans]|uniref:hypothetical protein n=1 Tax=Paenibacillus phytohabitans TaxID=2654978 RepID=UPI00300B920C
FPIPPTFGGIRGIYPFNFPIPPTFGGNRGIYPFDLPMLPTSVPDQAHTRPSNEAAPNSKETYPQQTKIIIPYTEQKPARRQGVTDFILVTQMTLLYFANNGLFFSLRLRCTHTAVSGPKRRESGT